MKKLFTLLTIIVLFTAATISTVSANGTISSTEEKIAASILIKPIDRKTINELFLNEMQYIQLKSLSKQYQKDVASISKVSLLEETPKDANLQLLNSRYYKELNNILTDHQISMFLQQNTVASIN